MAASKGVQLGIVLAAALVVAAGSFYVWKNPRPDPDVAKLEKLVDMASTACLTNVDSETAAKVGADLKLLLTRIKGEGGVTEYRKKVVGASNAIPPELQAAQSDKIRDCMSKYMPGILKTIGIEMPDAGRPSSRIPSPLELRFSYRFAPTGEAPRDDSLRINLQTARRVVEGLRLARQDGGHYTAQTAYPEEGERISGSLIRVLEKSTTQSTPAAARFCLARPASLPISLDDHFHLDCVEGGACAGHVPSPPWLDVHPCEATGQRSDGGVGLIVIARAEAAEQGRRWAVPSVTTLNAHRDWLKGVGYTLFTIETDAFRDSALIGVEVDVRVNGVAIHEDGLPPEQRPVPATGSTSFRHRFALESLDFQGADGGCEAIALTLTPRHAEGSRKEAAARATLGYVALRDRGEETIPLGRGALKWSARYVIPADEWSHEAFITSVSYAAAGGDDRAASAARERTAGLKRAFDALRLVHDGRPLVAVIRPPLTLAGNTLAYGLAAGVVQPSGQVRFTFSLEAASALAETLLRERASHAAAKGVVDAKKYVYRVAGNKERRETPTPAGVCRHVM